MVKAIFVRYLKSTFKNTTNGLIYLKKMKKFANYQPKQTSINFWKRAIIVDCKIKKNKC